MATVCADRPCLDSPIPPPLKRPYLKVVRPKPNHELGGICINQDLIAVYTHWTPGLEGKVRCLHAGDSSTCDGCPETERRWYGYMPVLWGNGRVMLLEVTQAAAVGCPSLYDKRTPLRGMYLKIGRHNGGNSARCYAQVEKYHRECKGLPPAYDGVEVLNMIFAHCESGLPSKPPKRKRGDA